MAMNQGLKSLWSSLRAFVMFWVAFVCATICNSLIPFDVLRESYFFKHLITQSMVDLRVKVVNTIMKDGLYNIKDVVLTMIQNATMNFIGYFKEIFVIVTVFHFTPLVSGAEIYFMIPKWLKKILRKFGLNFETAHESEHEYYEEVDDEAESSAEPPPLEDVSHLLSPPTPHSPAQRKTLHKKTTDVHADAPTCDHASHSHGHSHGHSHEHAHAHEHPHECAHQQEQEHVHDHAHTHTHIVNTTHNTPQTTTHNNHNNHNTHGLRRQNTTTSAGTTSPSNISDTISSNAASVCSASGDHDHRHNQDWYVFDPVYGVIPQETRELWSQQEETSNQRKQALLEAFRSQGKTLPPIRYSGGASAAATEDDYS